MLFGGWVSTQFSITVTCPQSFFYSMTKSEGEQPISFGWVLALCFIRNPEARIHQSILPVATELKRRRRRVSVITRTYLGTSAEHNSFPLPPNDDDFSSMTVQLAIRGDVKKRSCSAILCHQVLGELWLTYTLFVRSCHKPEKKKKRFF